MPAEGIGLILGVDRFLDMCRTTLNVTGDLVLATVVSRGETDDPIAPKPESAADRGGGRLIDSGAGDDLGVVPAAPFGPGLRRRARPS